MISRLGIGITGSAAARSAFTGVRIDRSDTCWIVLTAYGRCAWATNAMTNRLGPRVPSPANLMTP